jgi:UDP-N-acetyl-D-galactosamine dehydrogenase
MSKNNQNLSSITISVVGLGYVGLPLALEFGKKFKTIGYDKSLKKINSYKKNIDINSEIPKSNFIKSKNIIFTNSLEKLILADFIIIAVPTPVKKNNDPDLSILKKATIEVAKNLKKNSIIVYESTVYPGATEEICIPLIEKYSNYTWKKDFNVGYSPERINPGDKKHTLTKICKVVSGDTSKTTKSVKNLYSKIIKAGIYEAKSIKVAEAAKVIENSQRDINIAFVNELSKIFNIMDIDTKDVLDAAATKWNFLRFKPGLVGGHCIGVDPYYLTYKSSKLNYKPKIILSGRKLNDDMAIYVAKRLINAMKARKFKDNNNKILIMGFTFKENCSDFRNSKIIDIYNYLTNKKYNVDIFDPIVDSNEVFQAVNIKLETKIKNNYYDAVILAVEHNIFIKKGSKQIKKFGKKDHVFFDLKSAFPKNESDLRL